MKSMTHPRATLANGLPAHTRDRRIRQSGINRHGTAEKARQALWGMEQANGR